MAAPTTSRDLLDLIRRSGLVEEKILRGFLSTEEGLDNAKAVIRRLLDRGLITRFQAEQLSVGRWKGFIVGSYRLLDKLGKGGMGQVYLAEHTLLQKKVALKVLSSELSSDKKILARFAREARAAAAVSHPNIVHMIDIDIDHNPPFLVMEYINGITFQAAVAKTGTFTAGFVASCGVQTAMALHAAYEAGMVHRDIKPANLLLESSGNVKLLDLGIVRMDADDEGGLTATGGEQVVLGTADYVAPEQAIDSHRVDIRADIYGLGGSLYFLLAGHSPFPNGSTNAKLTRKQFEDPFSIIKIRPDIPSELARIIHLLMARNRDARPATPWEVATLLQPFAKIDEDYLGRAFGRTRTAEETNGISKSKTPYPPRMSPLYLTGEPTDQKTIINGAGTGEQATIRVDIPRELEPGLYDPQRLVSDSFATDPEPIPDPAEGESTQVRVFSEMVKTEKSPVPDASPPEPKRKLSKLILALGLGLLGLFMVGIAAGIGWYFLRKSTVSPETVPSAVPITRISAKATPFVIPASPIVSRGKLTYQVSKNLPNCYRSVTDVLKIARDGSRIEIRDNAWEETITLSAEQLVGRDIELTGTDPNKKLIWRGHPSLAEAPIIRLIQLRGFKISNIAFEGQKKFGTALMLSGSGIELVSCLFTDFTGITAYFHSVHQDYAVNKIEKCLFVCSDTLRSIGIGLLTVPRSQNTEVLKIVSNRFEGPHSMAIQIQSTGCLGTIERNRIANLGIGIDLTAAAQGSQFAFNNNTFANVDTAIRLPVVQGHLAPNLQANGNLFANVNRVVEITGLQTKKLPPAAPMIWDTPYDLAKGGPTETRFFRTTFDVPHVVAEKTYNLELTRLCKFKLWVNGKPVAENAEPAQYLDAFDISKFVHHGKNVIALEVTSLDYLKPRFAGFSAYVSRGADLSPLLMTGETWKAASTVPANWVAPKFDDSMWKPAAILREADGKIHYRDLDSIAQAQRDWPGVHHLFLASKQNLITSPQTLNCGRLPAIYFPLALSLDPAVDNTFLRTPNSDLPEALRGRFGVPQQ
jgi:serine/threonine protein kinase